MLHKTIPFQVLPSTFLLQYFHSSLTLDFLNLFCCLLFGLPHHIFFIAVISQLATTASSRQTNAFKLLFSFPAGTVTRLIGRCIINESAFGFAKSLKRSLFIPAFRSVWSIFFQDLSNLWVSSCFIHSFRLKCSKSRRRCYLQMSTRSFKGRGSTLIVWHILSPDGLVYVLSITRWLLSLIEGRIIVKIALGNLLHIGMFGLLFFSPILGDIVTPITRADQLFFTTHHILNQFLPLQRILSQLVSTELYVIQNRTDVVLYLVKVCLVLAIIIAVSIPFYGLVKCRGFYLQIMRIFKLTVKSPTLTITWINKIVDLSWITRKLFGVLRWVINWFEFWINGLVFLISSRAWCIGNPFQKTLFFMIILSILTSEGFNPLGLWYVLTRQKLFYHILTMNCPL